MISQVPTPVGIMLPMSDHVVHAHGFDTIMVGGAGADLPGDGVRLLVTFHTPSPAPGTATDATITLSIPDAVALAHVIREQLLEFGDWLAEQRAATAAATDTENGTPDNA